MGSQPLCLSQPSVIVICEEEPLGTLQNRDQGSLLISRTVILACENKLFVFLRVPNT